MSWNIQLTFNYCDAYQLNEKNEVVRINSITLETLYLPSYIRIKFNLKDGYKNYIPDIKEMTFNYGLTQRAYITADGNIFVSYLPQPEQYTLQKRKMYIEGKEYGLTGCLNYKNNNAQLTMYGEVKECTADGISLFPTFSTWVLENVLIAPLALITILYGRISLSKKFV